tara:strand:+ start:308 stop:793 length:486 start_codon:yes stop_codon:yes gene_type:complete
MYKLKSTFYLKLIISLSFIALISAYFIEYVLGYQPCKLCLIERIPYGLSIILITTIFIIKKNESFFILLLILTFIFSISITIYHFGIEQGFFEESLVCGIKDLSEIITKEDVLEQLNKKTISCKDVTFKVFGLSLTSINIMLNFFLLVILTNIFLKYEKNK